MGSMINPESKDRVTKLMEPVFGIEGVPQEVYASNAVLNRVDEIKSNKRELIIDCDVDDFLVEPNRELHRRLVQNTVSPDYTERPGAHTWEYWGNAVPSHVVFFSKVLRNNTVAVKQKLESNYDF